MKNEIAEYMLALLVGISFMIAAGGLNLWLSHDPISSCNSACNGNMKSFSADGICECRETEITE